MKLISILASKKTKQSAGKSTSVQVFNYRLIHPIVCNGTLSMHLASRNDWVVSAFPRNSIVVNLTHVSSFVNDICRM